MTKIYKQYSLSLESDPHKFSIGLLNKNKIVKVKSFNLDNHKEDKDNMFLRINNFFKTTKLNIKDISSLYVGCGPGSFTNIRKTLSLAIGLKVSISSFSNKELFIIGINSLSAIAYQYFLSSNFSIRKLVLATIDTNCGDYYIQLFSQKKLLRSITAISPILCMKPEKFEHFLCNYTCDSNDVTILGSEKSTIKNFNFPSAYYVANIGVEIERQEKQKKSFVIDRNLYNLEFIPIYAKNPNIVTK